jgi:hypothetical protein
MKRSARLFVSLVIALTVMFAWRPAAFAQGRATTADLGNQVLDSTGASVPDVSVTAINVETNLTRTVTTGADGR